MNAWNNPGVCFVFFFGKKKNFKFKNNLKKFKVGV